MLYLFYGTDKNKALQNALKIIQKKLAEKNDALVFKIDSQNINKDILVEMSGSRGLFSNKYIVHIKNVCEEIETRDILISFLKEIKESENIFILTEGDLNKKDFLKFEKYSEKVWNFEKKNKFVKQENIFDITTHVINRDKKNLWIEYQKIKNIFTAEEIHGTIFWAFKNIMLVCKTKKIEETGLKYFVYTNSKKALLKFSNKELQEKFWMLTKILGDARKGEGPLEILLEGWILDL